MSIGLNATMGIFMAFGFILLLYGMKRKEDTILITGMIFSFFALMIFFATGYSGFLLDIAKGS